MKLIFTIPFLSLMFVSIFSCHKQTEVKIVSSEPIVVEPRQNVGGTDSAGGSNGANGKPLDSYIETHFLEIPAMKDMILPIVQQLARIDEQVAADFFHISLNRDWYFIPVKLDMISKQIIGSYGVTDQLALQDVNKIWVDSKAFNKMDKKDQATLIVHEIIMGMRLMRYQHKQDHCLAEASILLISQQSEKYEKTKFICRSTYPKLIGSSGEKFNLQSDDYDLIRKVVSLIMTEEKIKQEEAVLLIRTSQLRETVR